MKFVSWYVVVLIMTAILSSSAKSEPQDPNQNLVQSGAHNGGGGVVVDAAGNGGAAKVVGSGSAQTCYPGQGGSGGFRDLPQVCLGCHPGGVSSKKRALERVNALEMPPGNTDRAKATNFANLISASSAQ